MSAGAVHVAWRSVRADNPGPLTLEGTNTYVLGEPGGDLVIIDPGPDLAEHRAAVLELVQGDHVSAVVLTHTHPDHADNAVPLLAELGAGVPLLKAEDGTLREGQQLADAVTVLTTPGHSDDSACLVLGDVTVPHAVLTGDTILGRGTTVLADTDGALTHYLGSLEKLAALGAATVLPGHGPVLDDLAAIAVHYLRHREERLDQVRAALERGATTPREVVEVVYADVDEELWTYAEKSVRAQLDHLGVAYEKPDPAGPDAKTDA
ncbi:MAG TPA: MBL fold metallo-hydrolase [Mycobacteriales bacterium]|nr:MBL fold metallo-hydrolase [Mycobacteriales bacterium]